MKEWKTRRELVTKNLTMWRLFRIVDGVEELDCSHYATLDEAITRARELNAREEATK
nr:MAG TPA: hypothetical protein [Caudoviricetes sp.]